MTGLMCYTCKNGFLYDEGGDRERFDGRKRTAAEWQNYLEEEDIRGTVR